MNFFGIVFMVVTTFVLFFKREESDKEENSKSKKQKSLEESLTVAGTYKLMWSILWLIPIKKLVFILMTVKVNHENFCLFYVN
jgi:Na+/H+ antiporter NhaC